MSALNVQLPGANYSARFLRDDGLTYAGYAMPGAAYTPGAMSAALAGISGLSAAEIARSRNVAVTSPHQPREPVAQGTGWALYNYPGSVQAYVARDDGSHMSFGLPQTFFNVATAAAAFGPLNLSTAERTRVNALASGT